MGQGLLSGSGQAQPGQPGLHGIPVHVEENRWPSLPVPGAGQVRQELAALPDSRAGGGAEGITVLPVKSLAATKVSTGQAAMPHQMG